MKKIWKTRKENEGVSPVIATILMVAITVVLAAVLYVMVINMGDIGGETAPPGSVTFDVLDSTSVKITFGMFSPEPAPMDIKVRIVNTSDVTDVTELSFSGAPDAGTVDMVVTGGASATYTDMNYQSNHVNSGDFIVVTGLAPHSSYEISVYHYESDSLCQLAGDSTFSLP